MEPVTARSDLEFRVIVHPKQYWLCTELPSLPPKKPQTVVVNMRCKFSWRRRLKEIFGEMDSESVVGQRC